ncbi:MAG: YbhN family protein [Gemmatimonadota bacterium]
MRWKLGFRIAISLAVLGSLLLLLPWGEVRGAASRLPGLVWLGVLGGFLAGHRLGAAKWRLMVNVGRAGLRPRQALRCYASGLFANLCLPSIVGGDVLRAAMAGRATGRPEAAVLGGIGDRLSDVAALALLLGAGALLAQGALPDWGGAAAMAAALVGLGGGALLVRMLARRRLSEWPRRLRCPIGRSLVAARRLARHPGAAGLALLISLAMQSGFVLLNAWIGRSIGIMLPVGVWFLAWPLAKLAGLLPVSLGGLGIRDATLGAILAPMGVPLASGVVASLIWQSVLIAGGLVAGGIALLLRGPARGRFTRSGSEGVGEAGPLGGTVDPSETVVSPLGGASDPLG